MIDPQGALEEPIQNVDPFARFLRGRLHLSPVGFGLLVLLADLIVDAIACLRYGTFLSAGPTPGLLQDYTALAVDFVMNPLICGLYLWTAPGAKALFSSLHEEGVFRSPQALQGATGLMRGLSRSRVAFYVALAASACLALMQLGAYLGWFPWKTVGGYIELQPAISYFRAPFWFLTFYAMLYGVFNVGVTVAGLRAVFRTKDIRLLTLHPDGCGGLRSITRYTVHLAWGIASVGLVLSAAAVFELQRGSFTRALPVLVGIAAYLLFAPVLFFWPLSTAHDAMQEEKERGLLLLAQQFDCIYDRLKRSASEAASGDGIDFAGDISQIEQMKRLYQIAEDFPIWPFDTRSVRRFFVIVTTPVLPAAISILTGLLQNGIDSVFKAAP